MVLAQLLVRLLVGALCALTVSASTPTNQPLLLDATPASDAILGESPEAVTLTFDRALSSRDSWVMVTGEDGTRYNQDDGVINPADRFVISTELDPLPEGVYEVEYQAASLGGSTLIAGAYTFTIDLPEPRLRMVLPLDGQNVDKPRVPLALDVQFFDFGLYNNRVRLYVDGDLVDELRTAAATVDGLEPGVHEIRTVLARFDDEELPDTEQVVYIAVAEPAMVVPDEAPQASILAGVDLSSAVSQATAIGLAVVLAGVGFVLGRAAQRIDDAAPRNGGRAS
jgi:methionine-rich copper-binding protein CopC